MRKDWLHILSLGKTIDLNSVSEIQWNLQKKYDKRFRTVLYLSTGIGVSEEYTPEYNTVAIFAKEDRQALHAKFLSIPIPLSFDEVLPEDVVMEAD